MPSIASVVTQTEAEGQSYDQKKETPLAKWRNAHLFCLGFHVGNLGRCTGIGSIRWRHNEQRQIGVWLLFRIRHHCWNQGIVPFRMVVWWAEQHTMILAPAMIDNEQDSQKCCFRFVTYDMLAGVFFGKWVDSRFSHPNSNFDSNILLMCLKALRCSTSFSVKYLQDGAYSHLIWFTARLGMARIGCNQSFAYHKS